MTVGRYIGVDGCKAGWFAVSINADNTWEYEIHKTIRALWDAATGARVILIDIPIGLISGNGTTRECEKAARDALKPLRHSSVFSPPCRETLSARTYADACRINQQICGRKISRQAWGIAPKIKEVDDFLHSTPDAKGRLRETHPEICFWAMAGYRPMQHYKKSAEGAAERMALLKRAFAATTKIYRSALDRYSAKDLAPDDIIDALANAVTAVRLKTAGASLPRHPTTDSRGLPMEMVYVRAESF